MLLFSEGLNSWRDLCELIQSLFCSAVPGKLILAGLVQFHYLIKLGLTFDLRLVCFHNFLFARRQLNQLFLHVLSVAYLFLQFIFDLFFYLS